MPCQTINFTASRNEFLRKKRRLQILDELEAMIWYDMDALFQLDDYCKNRKNRVDKRVEKVLTKKGLLLEGGILPDATNEAMYQFRTGEKPFWL